MSNTEMPEALREFMEKRKREQQERGGTEKPRKKMIFPKEEVEAFNEWLLDEKQIDYKADRPKSNFVLLAEQREEVVTELANRSGEWKAARSIMQRRLHPDTGGNMLAFQFYEIFDRLMSILIDTVEYIVFEEKIDKYKEEWLTHEKEEIQ